jgi:hypothetical protein
MNFKGPGKELNWPNWGISRNWAGETRENHEILSVSYVPDEIRTHDLPNTSDDRYRYMEPLSRTIGEKLFKKGLKQV